MGAISELHRMAICSPNPQRALEELDRFLRPTKEETEQDFPDSSPDPGSKPRTPRRHARADDDSVLKAEQLRHVDSTRSVGR